MTYEAKRTVQEGDAAIHEDDFMGRDPTKGVFILGLDPGTNMIRPVYASKLGVHVTDSHVVALLSKVLKELRDINMHLQTITDEELL